MRSAYLAYVDAEARGDYEAACKMITDRMRTTAIREARLQQPNVRGAPEEPVGTCPDALAVSLSLVDKSSWDTVRDLGRRGQIEVRGDSATIETSEGSTELKRVDGRWLVDAS